MASNIKEHLKRTQIYWWWRCYITYMHSKWLAGRSRTTVFLQQNQCLEKNRNRCNVCILVEETCWKVTKYGVHLSWLPVPDCKHCKRPLYLAINTASVFQTHTKLIKSVKKQQKWFTKIKKRSVEQNEKHNCSRDTQQQTSTIKSHNVWPLL